MEDIKPGTFTKGISVVFSYLKQHKAQALSLLFLGIISAVGNGLMPYIVGSFLDSLSSRLHEDVFIGSAFHMPLYMFLIIILWVVVQLIVSVVEWMMNSANVKLSSYARFSYVAKAYGHLLELPMSFHKKERIGTTISKIDIAADGFETILRSVVIELGPKFLTIIIACVITFYINAYLTAVLLVGVGIYVAITLRTSKAHTTIEKRNLCWLVRLIRHRRRQYQ
jgi:ABC-type multidrug transport system fused ATPase/permease subunit